ncbi:MAG TPA: hypothetical protein H9692_00855 [Firmicutes bacterium]|nr:hypothetical protein [Bacillota bacterium]
MKKVISVFVLAVMAASVLFAVAGCSGNSGMQAEIDTLKQSIEDLVSENGDLSERVEDLENKNNVFWTDKAEYDENETMTVYFKDTAVFKIRLNFDTSHGYPIRMSKISFNYFTYVTSLVSDITGESVLGTSYVACETVSSVPNPDWETVTICRKNEETSINGNVDVQEGMLEATSYDFVICVPGTAFELARFVDVSVYNTAVT